MKVVPYNFSDDLGREDAVGIEEMSITYIQPADTCSSSDDVQMIKLTTQHACSFGKAEMDEGQGGFYFNVEIPEGHWSIENGEQLAALVNDFKQRLYKTTKYGKVCASTVAREPETDGK